MRIFAVLFLIQICVQTPALSQTEENLENPTVLGVKGHYGFIIPHRKDLKPISESNPWGIQLDASKFFISQKAWDKCNCYSKAGFSFTYFNYMNPEVLGNSYNLIFFIEPQFGFNKDFFFSYRAGAGLAYLDRVYHESENPQNIFYSSQLSFMLLMNLGLNYRINPNWIVNLSGFYNHISNGGIKMPNKGINFPTVALGVDYIINPTKAPLPKRMKSKELDKRLRKYVRLYGTVKTVDADEYNPDVKKLTIGINPGVLKPISKINALSLGMEFARDGSFEEKNRRFNEDFDPYVVSAIGGHNFTLGKVIFSQEIGFYLYKSFPFTTDQIYQRYGLYYNILGPIEIGLTLKAHGAVAEIIDLRLGVLF